MSEYVIAIRKNHDTFEVWLDEDDGPVIGANALVLGSGPTRAQAIADAQDELTNHVLDLTNRLAAMVDDADAHRKRTAERAAQTLQAALDSPQTALAQPNPNAPPGPTMGVMTGLLALEPGTFDIVEPYPDAEPVIVLRAEYADGTRPTNPVGGITAREAFERLLRYARSWEAPRPTSARPVVESTRTDLGL